MPKQDRLSRAEDELARHALAYPGAHEDFPWGHRVAKVKQKLFVILGNAPGACSVTVKLPESGPAALTLPFAEPTGYGLGKSGWVTARFGPADRVPLDMLKEWIDESFRAVAPKKILAELEKARGGGPADAAPKRGKRRKSG